MCQLCEGFVPVFSLVLKKLSMRKKVLFVFLDQRHLVICLKSIYLVKIKVCVINVPVSKIAYVLLWFHGVLLIIHSIKSYWGTSLGGPRLENLSSNAGDSDLIPSKGTRVPCCKDNESCGPQLLSFMPQLESLCQSESSPMRQWRSTCCNYDPMQPNK